MGNLRIARADICSAELGVLAVTFWIPGCSIRCPGCHSKELWDPDYPCKWLNEDDVRVYLRARRDLCSWVVLLGGEPTEHEESVVISRLAREEGFKVALFTGLTEKQLENNPDLALIRPDFVKFGPYLENQQGGKYGSLNQSVR